MTRKKFIKFLMAHGISRNDANIYAIQMSDDSYDKAYELCCKILKCNNADRLAIYGSKNSPAKFYITADKKQNVIRLWE